MLHKRRSFGTRKVSPPQPTCMTPDQKANYLKDLRNNRPARPTGSRPLPNHPSLPRMNIEQDVHGHASKTVRPLSREINGHEVHRYSLNNSASMSSMRGRPLATAPNSAPVGRKTTPPEIQYREFTARHQEKREAQSLRQTLEEMDFQEEDKRIYDAAQLEAADLVWKHRNPGLADTEKTAAYRNPDLAKKRYVILNEGSTLDRQGSLEEMSIVSTGSSHHQEETVMPLKLSKSSSREGDPGPSLGSSHAHRRRSSGNRKASGGFNKGIFRNPEDQIYEEPVQAMDLIMENNRHDAPLKSRTRNSIIRGSRPLPGKPKALYNFKTPRSEGDQARMDAQEQTRDAEDSLETPKIFDSVTGQMLEIRSDEIRAATSMKRSSRSPKLPTPTAVSDKPGRPIVSFDPSWKPGNDSPRGSLDADKTTPFPQQRVSSSNIVTVPIPTISLQKDTSIPQINLPSEDGDIAPIRTVPRINITDEETPTNKSTVPEISVSEEQVKPLPSLDATSSKQKPRPLPSHSPRPTSSSTSIEANAHKTRLPWLSRAPTGAIPGGRGATVTCTACGLPIAGRIVTASASSSTNLKARLHPECFTCFHCNTGLECVSFYPEPDSARAERLNREMNAQDSYGTSHGLATSEESELRFFCHLDYHDLFSPRCASCHTPIEGSVIVAAGKNWHEGHFFCAECGDPFSASDPFVENKGYAYCVGCHTKRTSARCRGCQKQILDEISIEALGGKWHEDCFRCDECGSDFGDDGRFFVREIEVDLTEKEKRKGFSYRKTEERAVCDSCEGKRLKSKDIAAFL